MAEAPHRGKHRRIENRTNSTVRDNAISSSIRNGYADTPFGQIHYRRVDSGGVPIVLLHRTPVASSSFAGVLDRLTGKRAAIAFDTPGFGASFAPDKSPDTVDYARYFLAALDALGVESFHLAPHHTGTHFAAEMALLAPGRCRSLLLNGVLYAGEKERAAMRAAIGASQPIDPDGQHITNMWSLMRGMFGDQHPDLTHAETMGAMTAFAGRDQAFDAILSQDFAAVLARVACPVRILQACDDPLMPMLARVRAAHPDIPIDFLGPAGIAAPERQPEIYAAAALCFAADCDHPITPRTMTTAQGPLMTDRRFQLVRSPSGFDLEQVAVPQPIAGAGEVLIRVRAVSINRRDLGVRDFSYPVAPDADRFVPLSDAAGEVVAVGAGVTRFAVGDRVCSTFFPGWSDGRITLPAIFSAHGVGGSGVFADHVALPETGVAPIPEDWSFEEGASIACAGVTAWSALMPLGQLKAGDWALIIGTGGVALFALQIAVAAGARAVVLSSSDEKLRYAEALGAEATINYRDTPDWSDAVKAATGGGVQHVVELGGAGTLPKSIASLAPGGHLALIGALDGFGGDVPAISLIMGALRVSAVMVGSHADHMALTAFLTDHQIKPIIDSIFDVDAVDQAFARAAKGGLGKVVIRMGA